MVNRGKSTIFGRFWSIFFDRRGAIKNRPKMVDFQEIDFLDFWPGLGGIKPIQVKIEGSIFPENRPKWSIWF